jgi:hypothetical protein
VEREGADSRRAQAAAGRVGDLGPRQQGGHRLGGPFDPARAGADGDAGGHPEAGQGAARGLPGEAVVARMGERVEPVVEADDPAEQGPGLQPSGPWGRVGPGALG